MKKAFDVITTIFAIPILLVRLFFVSIFGGAINFIKGFRKISLGGKKIKRTIAITSILSTIPLGTYVLLLTPYNYLSAVFAVMLLTSVYYAWGKHLDQIIALSIIPTILIGVLSPVAGIFVLENDFYNSTTVKEVDWKITNPEFIKNDKKYIIQEKNNYEKSAELDVDRFYDLKNKNCKSITKMDTKKIYEEIDSSFNPTLDSEYICNE